MEAGSTIRSSQATPVYRAIAQLVEQVKRRFVKSACSNFLRTLNPLVAGSSPASPFYAQTRAAEVCR